MESRRQFLSPSVYDHALKHRQLDGLIPFAARSIQPYNPV